MRGLELVKELFKGNEFFSDLSKPDPKVVVPRGRVVNLFVTIRAENEMLIRHEGGEDVSLATIGNEKYPIILYEKVQSALRRNMLSLLRSVYDKHKGEVNKLRGKEDEWLCSLRPSPSTGAKKSEERMGGLCRECPNCMVFGFAVAEGEDYNLKSRVEGDLFIATTPEQKSVVVRTFNAVDDITKTTFIETEGTRTGSLFRLSLVKEGTIFVGKIALKDLSPAEFALTVLSLSTLGRIGGNTTDFGRVKVTIPAVVLAPFEVSSSLDVFYSVKGVESLEEVNAKIRERVKEFNGKDGVAFTFDDLGATIREKLVKNGVVDHEIVLEAWQDGLNFKKSIELFIKKEERPRSRREKSES